jgi:VWFA-related protein
MNVPACLLVLSGCLAIVLQTQRGSIRTGVEAVAADFLAVDSHGAPVLDLQATEILLSIDGKGRPLTSLSLLRWDLSSSATASAASSASDSTIKGDAPVGRAVILLFAHENIRSDQRRPVVEGAQRFISRLAPADRVAVVTIPNGRIEVNLTTDRGAVHAALDRIPGYSRAHVPLMTRPALMAVVDFLNGLGATDDPKIVVLVAQGILPATAQLDLRQQRAVNRSMPDYEWTYSADFKAAGEAAASAHAYLYVIQPHNFSGASGFSSAPNEGLDNWGQKGLEDFTGVTGGELFRLSGTADAIFDRIARESSAYYLAGFAVEDADRTGKVRRIRIEVTRPGVIVRARPSFRIPTSTQGR